jgi:acyl carrier protein
MAPETFARVRDIVARYLDIPAEKVEPDSKLEELGLDSLGALELIFQIEEEFKIVVPNERAAEFLTVRAVCEGIETLQAAAPVHPRTA